MTEETSMWQSDIVCQSGLEHEDRITDIAWLHPSVKTMGLFKDNHLQEREEISDMRKLWRIVQHGCLDSGYHATVTYVLV